MNNWRLLPCGLSLKNPASVDLSVRLDFFEWLINTLPIYSICCEKFTILILKRKLVTRLFIKKKQASMCAKKVLQEYKLIAVILWYSCVPIFIYEGSCYVFPHKIIIAASCIWWCKFPIIQKFSLNTDFSLIKLS